MVMMNERPGRCHGSLYFIASKTKPFLQGGIGLQGTKDRSATLLIISDVIVWRRWPISKQVGIIGCAGLMVWLRLAGAGGQRNLVIGCSGSAFK
jgi:hypothetical protein